MTIIYENSSAKFYQNNKERLKNKSREKYWSLSEKEKNKKREYGGSNIKISQKMKKTSWVWKTILSNAKHWFFYYLNQIWNKKLQLSCTNIRNYKKFVFKVNIKNFKWDSKISF